MGSAEPPSANSPEPPQTTEVQQQNNSKQTASANNGKALLNTYVFGPFQRAEIFPFGLDLMTQKTGKKTLYLMPFLKKEKSIALCSKVKFKYHSDCLQ